MHLCMYSVGVGVCVCAIADVRVLSKMIWGIQFSSHHVGPGDEIQVITFKQKYLLPS